jgi:hypothetical protein
LLPAGAVAGWDFHPLESPAFSRRTPVSEPPGMTTDTVLAAAKLLNLMAVHRLFYAAHLFLAAKYSGFPASQFRENTQ